MLAPTCAREVRSGPVQTALLTPGWSLLLAPLGRLSAGAPGRGSGSRAGAWVAVDVSRDADVTWKDRRGTW